MTKKKVLSHQYLGKFAPPEREADTMVQACLVFISYPIIHGLVGFPRQAIHKNQNATVGHFIGMHGVWRNR